MTSFRDEQGKIKIPLITLLYILGVVATISMSWASFATKSDVEARDNAILKEMIRRDDERRKEVSELQQKVYDELVKLNEKIGSKAEKPNSIRSSK